MLDKRQVITLFPYFLVDKEIEFFGITIKPSTSLDKEDEETKKLIVKLARFFHRSYNKPVEAISYYIASVSKKEEWEPIKQNLDNASALLRFQVLSDHYYYRSAQFSNVDFLFLRYVKILG